MDCEDLMEDNDLVLDDTISCFLDELKEEQLTDDDEDSSAVASIDVADCCTTEDDEVDEDDTCATDDDDEVLLPLSAVNTDEDTFKDSCFCFCWTISPISLPWSSLSFMAENSLCKVDVLIAFPSSGWGEGLVINGDERIVAFSAVEGVDITLASPIATPSEPKIDSTPCSPINVDEDDNFWTEVDDTSWTDFFETDDFVCSFHC